MAGGGGHLLERTHELAVIDDSLRAAQAGRGSLTFVEGPPGIGKTELLDAGMRSARRRRMVVLSARGGELEVAFPYAVVRQLFDVDVVAAAADSLLRLGLLRSVAPCRFEHPILRSAVESEISPARRGRLHHGAARILAAAEMPVNAVAAHLMQTPPLGEPWIVSALARAARHASARGAPAGAVAYLQRALAERPAAPERRELLLDIGKAESQIHSPQAPGHLREALALAEHPDEVAAVALWLGQALYHSGALDEAFGILGDVVERTVGRDSDATLELEAYLLSIAGAAGKMTDTAQRAASLEARTPVDSRAAGAVQATLAFRELLTGGPRERVRARAERAVEDIHRSLSSSSHLSDRQAPGASLLWIDELDRATRVGAVRAGRRAAARKPPP